MFGDRFCPLREFMPYDDYLEFLSTIDIAIFAHDRQQAMGNTITLLGMGKKVFIRKGISQWRLFNKLGVKVFNIENLSVEHFRKDWIESNMIKVSKYFSDKNLKEQLSLLFNNS
jgi:hypothetical protein